MFINLPGFSVFAQESPEDTLATHPEDLGGHTGLGGTLPLTGACVPPLAFGGEEVARTGAGVDDGRLDDDSAILDQLADVGA
jgi:hypothetical protein